MQQQQGVSAALIQPAPVPARITPVQGMSEGAGQPPMALFSHQGNFPSAAPQPVSAPAMGGPMWGAGQGGAAQNMFATPQRTVTPLSKQDLEDLLS